MGDVVSLTEKDEDGKPKIINFINWADHIDLLKRQIEFLENPNEKDKPAGCIVINVYNETWVPGFHFSGKMNAMQIHYVLSQLLNQLLTCRIERKDIRESGKDADN